MENLDVTNLKRKYNLALDKLEELGKQTYFLIGLIIGAIISVPIQLLFSPLKLVNRTLSYGEIDVFKNVNEIVYAGIIIIFIIFVIALAYKFMKSWLADVREYEEATLPYTTDKIKLFEEIREFLHKECSFSGINFKSDDNRIIKCSKFIKATNFKSEHMKDILIISFSEENIIKIKFSPEIDEAMTLIANLIKKYQNS